MTHFKIDLNLSLTVIDVSVFFPFAEYGMSCCVLNDKLYMVGGQTSRTDVFNLITGEWHRTKDCNTKRMEAQVKRYQTIASGIPTVGPWTVVKNFYLVWMESYISLVVTIIQMVIITIVLKFLIRRYKNGKL